MEGFLKGCHFDSNVGCFRFHKRRTRDDWDYAAAVAANPPAGAWIRWVLLGQVEVRSVQLGGTGVQPLFIPSTKSTATLNHSVKGRPHGAPHAPSNAW